METSLSLALQSPMKHTFPCVESMRRVNLSNGRVVRVWRDRTKENLSASYDDADIVSTCITNALYGALGVMAASASSRKFGFQLQRETIASCESFVFLVPRRLKAGCEGALGA